MVDFRCQSVGVSVLCIHVFLSFTVSPRKSSNSNEPKSAPPNMKGPSYLNNDHTHAIIYKSDPPVRVSTDGRVGGKGGGALNLNFDGYFLMLIIKRGMGLTSVQEEEGFSLSQKNELC